MAALRNHPTHRRATGAVGAAGDKTKSANGHRPEAWQAYASLPLAHHPVPHIVRAPGCALRA